MRGWRQRRSAGPRHELNANMPTANETTNGGPAEASPDGIGHGQEPFITKPMVAQGLKKCTRTVDNLMQEGLPHYKVGRSVIFKWSEIVAYLAANCRVSRRERN